LKEMTGSSPEDGLKSVSTSPSMPVLPPIPHTQTHGGGTGVDSERGGDLKELPGLPALPAISSKFRTGNAPNQEASKTDKDGRRLKDDHRLKPISGNNKQSKVTSCKPVHTRMVDTEGCSSTTTQDVSSYTPPQVLRVSDGPSDDRLHLPGIEETVDQSQSRLNLLNWIKSNHNNNNNNNFDNDKTNKNNKNNTNATMHTQSNGHMANSNHGLPPIRNLKQAQSRSKASVSGGKKKMRCYVCGKKLGLTTTYECRCGGNFCPKHRYPETHTCSFDYKTEGRRMLARNNPVVTAPKLPKI